METSLRNLSFSTGSASWSHCKHRSGKLLAEGPMANLKERRGGIMKKFLGLCLIMVVLITCKLGYALEANVVDAVVTGIAQNSAFQEFTQDVASRVTEQAGLESPISLGLEDRETLARYVLSQTLGEDVVGGVTLGDMPSLSSLPAEAREGVVSVLSGELQGLITDEQLRTEINTALETYKNDLIQELKDRGVEVPEGASLSDVLEARDRLMMSLRRPRDAATREALQQRIQELQSALVGQMVAAIGDAA